MLESDVENDDSEEKGEGESVAMQVVVKELENINYDEEDLLSDDDSEEEEEKEKGKETIAIQVVIEMSEDIDYDEEENLVW